MANMTSNFQYHKMSHLQDGKKWKTSMEKMGDVSEEIEDNFFLVEELVVWCQ
jgi:hypothetical protein